MRTAEISRDTAETKIKIALNLDGSGKSNIDSGCGFLDHMLTLFSKHSKIDLDVKCDGDTEVDYHHTVEDIGITLGKAFDKAIGEKTGIYRYGGCMMPMDEALILSAVDISGRSFLSYDLKIPAEKVGDFDTELAKEFWIAFVNNANITLHLHQFIGENSHHIIEASFKCVARTLKQAVAIDPNFANEIPSTKGVL